MYKHKIEFKTLYHNIVGLFFHPSKQWKFISQGLMSHDEVIKYHFLPLLVVMGLIQMGCLFLWRTPYVAFVFPLLNLVANFLGIYLTFRIMVYYLQDKLQFPNSSAFMYVYYSGMVYVFFNSITIVLPKGFWEQLFLVLSLFTLRTLYIGIKEDIDIPERIKNSMFSINAVTLIVSIFVIRKVLCVLFSISNYQI